MRAVSVVMLLLVSAARSAAGQQDSTKPFCFRGRPVEHCRGFAITESGGWMRVIPGEPSVRRRRATLEMGMLGNVGRDWAVGGVVFASTNLDDETRAGAGPRVRRWLTRSTALDLTFGPQQAFEGGWGTRAEVAFTFGDVVSVFAHVETLPESARHRIGGAVVAIGAKLGSYGGLAGTLVALMAGARDAFSW